MDLVKKKFRVEHHLIPDNGRFPNNDRFPVLIYRKAFLATNSVMDNVRLRALLRKHGWSNAWKGGIYCYNHYHSTTHELLACVDGKTTLLLGGDDGIKIHIAKGDVLVIPAGVSHKNLGDENDLTVIGAYPEGKEYDMNYDRPGERPAADKRIKKLGVPPQDPLGGYEGKLQELWNPSHISQTKRKRALQP